MFDAGQLLGALLGGQPNGVGAPIPPMSGDAPMVAAPDPIAALVQGGAPFKKTHRNILGRLADVWLQSQGQKPVYEQRMQERDLEKVMEQFGTDPKTAARNLAMINPAVGIKLWDDIADNERADQAQARLNKVADIKYENDVIDRIVNSLGAANDKTYPLMKKRMEDYAARSGVELPFPLPETFDPDLIAQMRQGEMTVKQQMDYAIRQARLAQQGAATESLIEHRDETRAEKTRHNKVSEGQAAERIDQADTRINQAGTKIEMTREQQIANRILKTGHANPNIQYNKDRTKALIKGKDGVWRRYERVGADDWKVAE
jgi:hypothetical protein